MDTNISLHDLSSIQARAEAEGKQCLVGAVIINPQRELAEGGALYEVDFLVEIGGDLAHPQLEWSKNSEFRWLDLSEIELLNENRQEADTFVYDIVKKGLEMAARVRYNL